MNQTSPPHIHRQFDDELDALRDALAEMSTAVQAQLRAALALITTDEAEASEGDAQAVIAGDDEIDALDTRLQEDCARVIALRQPTAGDLRLVLAVLRAVTDLERVGDEACGIAKLATAARRMPGSLRRSIGHLGKAAGELLEQASEALLAGDAVAASALIGATERVDSESELLLREFISYFMEGGPQPGPVAESTLVLRALQRIADHATNLCEHTVYMATGSDPRRDRLPAERP